MIDKGCLAISLETPGLRLSAREAPWDTTIFGFPVVQIEHIEVLDPLSALDDYAQYRAWVGCEGIGIVSCRLPHDQLRESMFLEANGFRFVEMVLHPRLDGLQCLGMSEDNLEILPATQADLASLRAIAETAFGNERYHIDPRISAKLGDQRYGRWVGNSLVHETQQLLKVLDGGRLIGLFIVEATSRVAVYWHLTAISPQWQGSGYGRRVWRSMLSYHQAQGYEIVSTTVSARNSRVLNLYGQLGFRFMPPEMTFHWIRDLE
jgi:ribosomal protein S18 acetylase RimI-like enzyme